MKEFNSSELIMETVKRMANYGCFDNLTDEQMEEIVDDIYAVKRLAVKEVEKDYNKILWGENG